MADDNVQHGIDDNPHDDGKKGLELGALGGGAAGAMAGMVLGPVGAVVGALIGGTVGSLASGAAVDAVDKVDNDNTVSGVGTGASTDANTATGINTGYNTTTGATMTNMGNDIPGVQTGGMTTAGADTRGVTEKITDVVTGDRMDDKTGGTTSGMTGGSAISADYNTAAYGTYEGRQITRADYEKMPEQDRMRVQLIQEELHVDKATRQAGEVTVSKHVVEEQVQVPVTLQREEVVVTRHAVDRPVDAATAGEAFTDQTIRVPVHEEVAQVTKTAHVAEEIEIEKRSVSEQRTISDTVRHEELDVNTPGNVRVDDSTKGTTGKM